MKEKLSDVTYKLFEGSAVVLGEALKNANPANWSTQTKVAACSISIALLIESTSATNEGLQPVCNWIEQQCYRASFYDGLAKSFYFKSYPITNPDQQLEPLPTNMFNLDYCYKMLDICHSVLAGQNCDIVGDDVS